MSDVARGRERIIAIIPARMGSTRFPGKVLASGTGKPLIQHACEAAARAPSIAEVLVATDDPGVKAAVEGFGGRAVLTRPDHPSGTSRLAEAAAILGLAPGDIVVNVQGDEPEVEPETIEAAVRALQTCTAPVATVAVPFADGENAHDPNLVKVVRSADGSALYFSRSLIPYIRDPARGPWPPPLRHIGLYVYRRSFLETYLTLPETEPEQAESLEQLRILAHGYKIAVAVCPAHGHGGIDTPQQYEAFVRRWRERRG